jgi:hypothetical protein
MHSAYQHQTRVHPACVRWRSADFVMQFWQMLAKYADSLNIYSIPTEIARTSSVSDPHSLHMDLDPAFLVNADPDLYSEYGSGSVF